ncbi:S-layer homology domain-containing protein [Patescibacteria group bacterium]|nr:S-layer homology domain-containing protein [Patescibacteria group bacterium]
MKDLSLIMIRLKSLPRFLKKVNENNMKDKILILPFLALISLSLIALFPNNKENPTTANLQADVFNEQKSAPAPEPEPENNILIIVGEGGPSGSMFSFTARTFQKENGGEIYEVHSGDEFNAAIRDYTEKHGLISHLEYFGHGNNVGLYVNQEPGINGGLYANDPALDESYIAASIFELSSDIFTQKGDITINGCNIANGYPEKNTLAQEFANYFDVPVSAPTGPTQFSSAPDLIQEIPNGNYLDSSFQGDVYLVPTYQAKAFVTVQPQPITNFKDVRNGQSYVKATTELTMHGLNLGFEDQKFLPYKIITYGQARDFCAVAVGDRELCTVRGYDSEDEPIRNLYALKMLVDAYDITLPASDPWHRSYISWANDLLTQDFINKKWYTRAEMAELTWNFINNSENFQ